MKLDKQTENVLLQEADILETPCKVELRERNSNKQKLILPSFII